MHHNGQATKPVTGGDKKANWTTQSKLGKLIVYPFEQHTNQVIQANLENARKKAVQSVSTQMPKAANSYHARFA